MQRTLYTCDRCTREFDATPRDGVTNAAISSGSIGSAPTSHISGDFCRSCWGTMISALMESRKKPNV